MARGMDRPLSAIVVILLMGACSSGAGVTRSSPTPSPRTNAACTVSLLEPGPSDFGNFGLAHAGPLWFSAFGSAKAGMPARLAPGGGPYDRWKVVVHPDPNASGTVALSGTDCSSGMAIRFCYQRCTGDTATQASAAELQVNTDAHVDYTGYMVFRGPGLVQLTVSKDNQAVASTVIDVP